MKTKAEKALIDMTYQWAGCLRLAAIDAASKGNVDDVHKLVTLERQAHNHARNFERVFGIGEVRK